MADSKTIISEAEEKMDMAVMYLDEALAHIRAGKADVRLLDGIRVDSYGSMVPINIPPLTEERRKQLSKQCKGEGETAKVSVRNARRDAIDALKKAVKDGMPEDEQKNSEAKLQKVHDKYIKQIDDMLAAKDKEIMTV